MLLSLCRSFLHLCLAETCRCTAVPPRQFWRSTCAASSIRSTVPAKVCAQQLNGFNLYDSYGKLQAFADCHLWSTLVCRHNDPEGGYHTLCSNRRLARISNDALACSSPCISNLLVWNRVGSQMVNCSRGRIHQAPACWGRRVVRHQGESPGREFRWSRLFPQGKPQLPSVLSSAGWFRPQDESPGCVNDCCRLPSGCHPPLPLPVREKVPP
jgi:hypothetical protein